jgi:hypothetical protein
VAPAAGDRDDQHLHRQGRDGQAQFTLSALPLPNWLPGRECRLRCLTEGCGAREDSPLDCHGAVAELEQFLVMMTLSGQLAPASSGPRNRSTPGPQHDGAAAPRRATGPAMMSRGRRRTRCARGQAFDTGHCGG